MYYPTNTTDQMRELARQADEDARRTREAYEKAEKDRQDAWRKAEEERQEHQRRTWASR